MTKFCPFHHFKECCPGCALYDLEYGVCSIALVMFEYFRLLKSMQDKPGENDL